MRTDHQIIADWLLKYMPDMKVPATEGQNATTIVTWLQAIASGALAVTSPPAKPTNDQGKSG